MPPLKLVRQPRVVDAEAVQDRGLQVVHVDRLIHDVVAVVVGFAVDADPRLMPPPAIHIVKQRG